MISIKISVGEAIDKLSILLIKQKYIQNESKLVFILKEIEELNRALSVIGDYSLFLRELIDINDTMWHCNEVRKQKIIDQQFDKHYIDLTIEESIVNDRRFLIKNRINSVFNSELKEQKSYNHIDNGTIINYGKN